ncbi:hypothetical protein [Candidatus Formimonas warabiya]|nr:hypothetical protein [Candidatus Formimonas warabiya]
MINEQGKRDGRAQGVISRLEKITMGVQEEFHIDLEREIQIVGEAR